MRYPPTPTVDVVDDYHGTTVADPYRWLEDPDDPRVREWIASQNRLCREWLDAIPARAEVRRRLGEVWDHPRWSAPFRRGARTFFFQNQGLQEQAVLHVQEDGDETSRILLDPNGLSEDGTVALGEIGLSEDGRWLAWSVSEGGSDWRTWRVRDVETGRDTGDLLRWSKFSEAAFTHDHAGFFYSRYDEPRAGRELEEPNQRQKLFYHRLGTPQSEDVLVYQRPDQPEWGFAAQVSEDGRYLVVTVWKGTSPRNGVFYQDLRGGGPMVELLADFDAAWDFVGNDGGRFYLRTDAGAPRGRLVAVDVEERGAPREIVPEQEETLDDVCLVQDTFFCRYLRDARDVVRRFSLAGEDRGPVELPGIGSLSGFGGRRRDEVFHYVFTSFLQPGTVYRHEVATGRSEVHRAPAIDFDPAPYTTRLVFCTSRDGTRIPLFLTHRRDLERDGRNPVYLYAYGGFGVSLKPSFSTSRVVWLERGGVYAQACVRGGGEYGESWHQAGSGRRKQNTFDDLLAVAEHLVDGGWTRPDRLAVAGGSNGGLTAAVCANQRPDLFGACLPAVGVLDMLRFHRWTIGWAWVSDYGCSDDPELFEVLRAYSPYHNVVEGRSHPATLITTGDHDDRVFPAHSFKYAARLQAAQGGPAPVLLRVETRAGHGAGKPTSLLLEEEADRWAFLLRVLGMEEDREGA